MFVSWILNLFVVETLSTRCASFNGAIKNVRHELRNPYYFRIGLYRGQRVFEVGPQTVLRLY